MPIGFHRRIGSIAHPGTAGEERRLELPRTALQHRLILSLYGTYTSSSLAGSLLVDQPETLLQTVEIVANGSQTLKRLEGAALRKLNLFDHQVSGPEQPIAAIGSTQEISSSWVVDFSMPRSVRPVDTINVANAYSHLEIRVRFGTAADIATVTGGTATFTDISLAIDVEEVVGLEVEAGLFRSTFVREDFTAQSGVQQMEIPTGDFFRAITLVTSGGSPVAPLNTLVETVSLRSGATRFVDGVRFGNAADTTNITDLGLEASNAFLYGITVPTGYRRLDFAKSGSLLDMLNTSRLEELVLDLDLGTDAQTGTAKAYLDTVVNPRFLTAR